ncbi:MAG: CopD family protein [Zoogloeaceae bacterium]|jgi:putative membrane protein|nr:CopD family protein [Zoogloeaceae bacterium]
MVLTLKTLHVGCVLAWGVALFYFFRILAQMCAVPASLLATHRILSRVWQLYIVLCTLALPAIACGLALWILFRVPGGWLHAKATLALILLGLQVYAGLALRRLGRGGNARGAGWFRALSLVPVVLSLIALTLALTRPF